MAYTKLEELMLFYLVNRHGSYNYYNQCVINNRLNFSKITFTKAINVSFFQG